MNSKNDLLERIEWHDLPVSEIRIAEQSFRLTVMPYSESREVYDQVILRLSNYGVLDLEIRSELTLTDQMELEVSTFDHRVHSDGRLSGQVGLLPGGAGYWKVRFENAVWDLVQI